MPASMVPLTAAREAARARVARAGRDWAVDGGDDAVFELPLHPPSEREVRASPTAARDWIASWRVIGGVQWVTRSWPSFGTQRVPDRLHLAGAEAIAGFAGAEVRREWRTMRAAVVDLAAQFGESDAVRTELRRSAAAVARLPVADLERLEAMLSWLRANPDSALRLRQLPVHGVHTKWLEQHRGLVERLHTAITGRSALGIVERPVLVRVRVLDAALRPNGLQDLSVPVADLALLPDPAEVLIVENLETLLALPDLPGTMAIFGAGYGVGGRLREVSWLQQARVRYWGDLDSQGFRILDDLRGTVPDAASVLMDTDTLEAHRDLAVREPQVAVGHLARLTGSEAEALAALRAGGDLRVEQERLDWQWVLDRLQPE